MSILDRICAHVGESVGGTPLVRLNRLARGLAAEVAVKLEYFQPGGSIKDRVAWTVLEEAERCGSLRPGQRVIELTSGNMGAGLAWACAVKGYPFIAVMSAGNSVERRRMIAAFGAQVEVVPQAPGGTPGQVSGTDMLAVEQRTAELVKFHGAFRPDQFNNPASVKAHLEGTGPEIWRQSGGRVTHFCSLVGTSGTLIGTAKALKDRAPSVLAYAVEPAGAEVLAGRAVSKPNHKLQGGGYALIPGIYEARVVDGSVAITDAQAEQTARDLAAQEGIMGGFSSGANVAAALHLARAAAPGALVVTVICDTGLKYLSTDLYKV